MAFTEEEVAMHTRAFELFREKFGPPPNVRGQLDWGCRIEGQSLELYEIRPRWNDPARFTHSSFAKATYVKSTSKWKIYWRRGNGKWDLYEPKPEADSLENFFKILREDAHGCFFG